MDGFAAQTCARAKLGMNRNSIFSLSDHMLKVRNRMWIESGETSVKRRAKKMPLALRRAGVMFRPASR
ncbi:hypothetical protein HYPGJ_30061 [Hyphomicrobium sp. GJ21]|nr:hypothetical protein HYPGJ_30061 [Hyphomicrobium sp. GJ21]